MKNILFAVITIAGTVLLPAGAARQVEPKAHYGKIAARIAKMLPGNHILKQAFDDEISRRAWTNIVTYYDFDHSVFLKEDLEKMAARLTTIDDEILAGDVSFGYEIHKLYVKRLGERVHFATNYIANAQWDFSKDEMFNFKRKESPWPETKSEAEEHWRKRIRNEYLAMKITRELEAEKKAKKDDSSSKTKKKDDDDFVEAELTPEKSLMKKYTQYYRVMAEPDEENVLQYYLSAVCRAYDPHTDYLSPMTEEDFEMGMNLKLCGVGATLTLDDGALKISEVMPGGPLDVDGRIKKGDKIVAVKQGDGAWEDIMWQPMNKSVRRIRGEKGTRVTLEIIPRSDPTGVTRKRIELVRDEIKLDSQAATGHVERVSMAGRDFKLGYVYLPSFYGTMDKLPGQEGFLSCSGDVAKYIAGFNTENVDGMVLDMRGNGGGSLKEAVLLSSLFVSGGPVVVVQDRRIAVPLSIPHNNPVAFTKPVVVMIDRASASAAEIVAGHLKDAGRAIVLGDVRTHGKGTVQSVMDLSRRSDTEASGSTKITTARFYRINGESTQVKGVESDIHLPSFLDHLDIGEDKLPNALPFSKLDLTDFRKAWNLNKYVDELKKKSEARTSVNEAYKKHIEKVEHAEEMFNRKEVTLEYAKRKALMVKDRAIGESEDEDEEEIESRLFKPRVRKDDVVLSETFKVLADLIVLCKGEEMPRASNSWMDLIIDSE